MIIYKDNGLNHSICCFLFSIVAAWYECESSAILDHPSEWRNSIPITQLMYGTVHESSNILQWDIFIYEANLNLKSLD
ncbi:DUF4306 domain-containing protein [Peribacillus simplex]|uniref:DUF4306 domain-containing protein n=1 Tax=Peribacillus simplex TaxID=1478 RepID=UPI0011DD00BC